MPDREKVIKGLTECVTAGLEKPCPLDCQYFQLCFPDVGPSNPFMSLMQDALTLLKEQETANIYKCPNCGTWVSAENVVLCKDCKHWLPMNRFDPDYHPGRGQCEWNCWVRDFDWFCADGKRKEGL